MVYRLPEARLTMNHLLRKSLLLGGMEIATRIPLVFAMGYMARRLGAADYGYWMLALAFHSLLFSIASLGLSTALSRLAPADDIQGAGGMAGYAMVACMATLAVAAFPVIALREKLGKFLGIPAEASALLGWGVIYVAAQLVESILDAYFKARELVARQALFQLMRSMVDIALIFAVFSMVALESTEQRMAAIGKYLALAVSLKILLYPTLLLHLGRWRWPMARKRRDMHRLGMPLIPAALLLALMYQEDRLILGQLVDAAALGVYAFGASLALTLHALGNLAYAMLLPRLSRFHDRGQRSEMQQLTRASQKLFISVFGTTLVGLALMGRELMLLLAGEEYLAAASILLIIGSGVALDRLFGPYESAFYLVRKPVIVLWLNLFSCITLAGGVVVGAVFGGALGCAWGVLAASCINNLARYWTAQRQIPLGLSPDVVRHGFAALLAVGLAAALADGLPLFARLAATTVAVAVAAHRVVSIFMDRREAV